MWFLNNCSHALTSYERDSLNIFMTSAYPRGHALEEMLPLQCGTQMWLSSLLASNRSIHSKIIFLLPSLCITLQ